MTAPAASRRALLAGLAGALAAPAVPGIVRAGEAPVLRGTGDLGLVVERADGAVLLVETTGRSRIARIDGLGDLSHASVCFSRDERYAYLFGRDGGLTKIDLLAARIDRRIVQAGNAIGGAISDDGTLVAVSNYEPGGVRVFDAATLAPVADIPAVDSRGNRSKTVGLVDIPFRGFAWSLYEGGEIWVADFWNRGNSPKLTRIFDIGRLPYDGVVTADGRHYVAGLFGEDALIRVDLWADSLKPERVLAGYGKGEAPLPVYKMPHLEGWAAVGDRLLLPAVGRHEVLVVDRERFAPVAAIPVHGQPVFIVARPDGRQAWVNFAHPLNDTVQVIDIPSLQVVHGFTPGPAVLHLEFTPRGHEVWISVRDADRVDIHETRSFGKIGELAARKPSGIFFTPRAHRIGV
ncbi:protein nirF [Prosthecomicrobium hirschii]|uniref:Protein nirF n=1 Tax=Prosthecodimorpha hirschii TaxID=665126 RepID=A0A0P6VMA8_9HYPH|nr:cytochrome D1 domain-containing protein [Prosthecomicrobium hirschii]KPL53808.1 protein nirF [Prosthecomicrobium hirschii]